MSRLSSKYRIAFDALRRISISSPDLSIVEAAVAAMQTCVDLGGDSEGLSEVNYLSEANMLLRSAYEIAMREGKETNWKAFAASVRKELFEQANVADLNDEQTILRVTCTPRTYRFSSSPLYTEP